MRMRHKAFPFAAIIGLAALLTACNPPTQLSTISIDDAFTDVISNPNLKQEKI